MSTSLADRIKTLENASSYSTPTAEPSPSKVNVLMKNKTLIMFILVPIVTFALLFFWNPKFLQKTDEFEESTRSMKKLAMATAAVFVLFGIGYYFLVQRKQHSN